MREIEGPRRDLESIRVRRGGATLRLTTIMGDFNIQPDELAGKREPRRKRQAAWERVRDEFGLILHNPAVQHKVTQSVWLPLRRKKRDSPPRLNSLGQHIMPGRRLGDQQW